MALMQAGPQLGQAPAYPAVGTGTGVHLALFFRLSSTLHPQPSTLNPMLLPGTSQGLVNGTDAGWPIAWSSPSLPSSVHRHWCELGFVLQAVLNPKP